LELILFRTIRRADTKPVANPLLNRFKSLPEVFGAREQFLTGLEGVGESTGFNLKG
jgi:DNA repair protein RadC